MIKFIRKRLMNLRFKRLEAKYGKFDEAFFEKVSKFANPHGVCVSTPTSEKTERLD
jgi:hypothetical protein